MSNAQVFEEGSEPFFPLNSSDQSNLSDFFGAAFVEPGTKVDIPSAKVAIIEMVRTLIRFLIQLPFVTKFPSRRYCQDVVQSVK